MKTPIALSEALGRTYEIVKDVGCPIIRSEQLRRADRELLIRTKWLFEIIKGWYLFKKPDAPLGESVLWYAHFWDFLRIYLHHHLGDLYCLSAKCSLDLHTKNPTIPNQVIVIGSKNRSSPQELPFQTSVLIYADPSHIPEERTEINGLWSMRLPYALCKVASTYFQKNPKEAEIALRLITNHVEILEILLKYNFKTAAGRLVGAYRFLGNTEMAEHLKQELLEFGWKVEEENPFLQSKPLISSNSPLSSPYKARILSLWSEFRPKVLAHFSEDPGVTQSIEKYLHHLEEMYVQDAYNSLSIEGYQVDEELINRVQNLKWNPDLYPEDAQTKNALAARGYYEAFLEVKKTLKILSQGENAGDVIKGHLRKWIQALFVPSVRSGLIPAFDLVGYRKSAVYIRGSRHIPFPKEALIEAMDTFFECLKQEKSAAVRAILGHYIFVFIHPYMDGNGRIGRFLMNTMFASGGYPWTIIRVKNSSQYINALEIAGTSGDIEPFVKFIIQEMQNGNS